MVSSLYLLPLFLNSFSSYPLSLSPLAIPAFSLFPSLHMLLCLPGTVFPQLAVLFQIHLSSHPIGAFPKCLL